MWPDIAFFKIVIILSTIDRNLQTEYVSNNLYLFVSIPKIYK